MPPLDDLLAQVASAQVFDLEHERYAGAPVFPAHWPGFVYTLHRRHEVIPGQTRTSASGTITAQEHSGTHIDALCHQAVDMCMHGGVEVGPDVQTPHGFTKLGVETIPPILRRGVLLDVPRALESDRLPSGYLVTGADLEATVKAQDVEIRPGDCVLIRTGTAQDFADPQTYLDGAGVGTDGARWLADHRPYLAGADNVAFDHPSNVDPELGSLPCHTVLTVEAGIYILENLQLEELAAAACVEFLFVCLPLKMRGVTGSHVRPVALHTGG
jgi:kynurenine formamidase